MWTPLTTLNLSPSWQFTEVVSGDFFRVRHQGAPANSNFLVSQVELDDQGIYDFSQVMLVDSSTPSQVLTLPRPSYFSQRRLAFRRINPEVKIEFQLREFLKPALFLPESVDLVYAQRWLIEISVSSLSLVTPSVEDDMPATFSQCLHTSFSLSATESGQRYRKTAILPNNPNRKYALIINQGVNDCLLHFGDYSGQEPAGIPLASGNVGVYEINGSNLYTGIINAINVLETEIYVLECF